jgi:Flp pilus assembly protein TadG
LVQVREFFRDRQGSTIIMVAVSLFMVLAVASLSIDAIYLYVLKDRLQMTADIAALAAVQDIEDEDQAKATAIEFATKNMETNDHGHVLSLVDVVVGRWDLDARSFAPGSTPANAVRVTTRRDEVNDNPAGLFFARVLGVNEAELTAQATAAFEPRKIELAMILDNSGSMDMFGGSMQYLIDAANQLLDMMFQGDSTLDESRISIVPFRALVHLGTEYDGWPGLGVPCRPAGAASGAIPLFLRTTTTSGAKLLSLSPTDGRALGWRPTMSRNTTRSCQTFART